VIGSAGIGCGLFSVRVSVPGKGLKGLGAGYDRERVQRMKFACGGMMYSVYVAISSPEEEEGEEERIARVALSEETFFTILPFNSECDSNEVTPVEDRITGGIASKDSWPLEPGGRCLSPGKSSFRLFLAELTVLPASRIDIST
jgi:hypothetical protein